jgi:hypothetical protein
MLFVGQGVVDMSEYTDQRSRVVANSLPVAGQHLLDRQDTVGL